MTNYQPELTEATEIAEESLLGSILIQSSYQGDDVIHKVVAIVQPEDFRGCVINDNPDRWIWRARVFYAMTKCEGPPHQINVANKMAQLGILQDGDCARLSHCIWNTPCSLDYPEYAKTVKDYSTRRQVKEHANNGDIRKLKEVVNRSKYKGLSLE